MQYNFAFTLLILQKNIIASMNFKPLLTFYIFCTLFFQIILTSEKSCLDRTKTCMSDIGRKKTFVGACIGEERPDALRTLRCMETYIIIACTSSLCLKLGNTDDIYIRYLHCANCITISSSIGFLTESSYRFYKLTQKTPQTQMPPQQIMDVHPQQIMDVHPQQIMDVHPILFEPTRTCFPTKTNVEIISTSTTTKLE